MNYRTGLLLLLSFTLAGCFSAKWEEHIRFAGKSYTLTETQDITATYSADEGGSYVIISKETYADPQENVAHTIAQCEQQPHARCQTIRCGEEDYIAAQYSHPSEQIIYTTMRRITPVGGVGFLVFHNPGDSAPGEELSQALCQFPL